MGATTFTTSSSLTLSTPNGFNGSTGDYVTNSVPGTYQVTATGNGGNGTQTGLNGGKGGGGGGKSRIIPVFVHAGTKLYYRVLVPGDANGLTTELNFFPFDNPGGAGQAFHSDGGGVNGGSGAGGGESYDNAEIILWSFNGGAGGIGAVGGAGGAGGEVATSTGNGANGAAAVTTTPGAAGATGGKGGASGVAAGNGVAPGGGGGGRDSGTANGGTGARGQLDIDFVAVDTANVFKTGGTTSTWIAPANGTLAIVAQGNSAAGLVSSTSASGGCGGGACCVKLLTVTVGQVFYVLVGDRTGGDSGCVGVWNAPVDVGATSAGIPYVRAGSGQQNSAPQGRTGGTGGVDETVDNGGTAPDIVVDGGNGGNAATGTSGGGGGGASAGTSILGLAEMNGTAGSSSGFGKGGDSGMAGPSFYSATGYPGGNGGASGGAGSVGTNGGGCGGRGNGASAAAAGSTGGVVFFFTAAAGIGAAQKARAGRIWRGLGMGV